MKLVLATTAIVAAMAFTPALAQEAKPQGDGNLRVEGIAPSRVLGAIETDKLVRKSATAQPTSGAPSSSAAASSDGDIRVDGVKPSSVLGAIDTSKLVGD
ncbi:MAG: hypothetical protein ABI740_09180, partial [Alphaproteobacteria bacterium]